MEVNHLGLPAELRDHVSIEHYEAGHMMYIRTVDHEKFKQDIVLFMEQATGGGN